VRAGNPIGRNRALKDRTSQALWQEATARALEDTAIVLIDREGVIRGWNTQAQALYGYSPNKIVGRSYSRLFLPRENASGLAAESLKAAEVQGCVCAQAIRRAHDGRGFAVAIKLNALRDGDGQVGGYAEVCRALERGVAEIAESGAKREQEKRNEAALWRHQFEAFANHLPGRVWLKDQRGIYLFVNSELEKTLRLQQLDWHGKTDWQLFPANAREWTANDRWVFAHRRFLQTVETSLEAGKTRHWLTSKFLVAGRAGTRLGAIAFEISEWISAREELLRIQRELFRNERMRAVGELAAGLAHDLNNTLNAMKLRLSLLSNDAASARHQSHLRSLNRFVNDAAARIERLHDFVRHNPADPTEAVEVGRVVREAIELVHSEVEEMATLAGRRITIENRLPARLPRVSAIGSELRHVLANLLLNARDAMPTGGSIEIGGRVEEGRVVVTVADHGIGIPEALIGRVFEPFFTTKGRQGTGLGLSMAREVMERFGGSISAVNRPQGGAEFSLRFLPARASGVTAAPVRHPRLDVALKVLVIEDDPDNLESIRLALELKGHAVETAFSGEAALHKLRQGIDCDTVICDVGMPGMSGWEVARAIGQLRPAIRIFMLTGWAGERGSENLHGHLVRAVLAKPIDIEHLNQIITTAATSEP
jgi:PAS domain S-box-containing protein